MKGGFFKYLSVLYVVTKMKSISDIKMEYLIAEDVFPLEGKLQMNLNTVQQLAI